MIQEQMIAELKSSGAYVKGHSEQLVDGMQRAHDLGIAQERDKWRAEVERMIEEVNEIYPKGNGTRALVRGFFNELLKNMESKSK